MKGRTLFTTLLVVVLLAIGLVSVTVAQEPAADSEQPPISAEKLQSQLERNRITEAEYEAAMSEAGLEAPVRGLPEDDILYVPPGWLVIDNLGTGGEWNSSDTFGVANRTNSPTPTSMAAEASGSGIDWDTELWSPPTFLNGPVSATVEFESNFQDYAGNGDAWVDISTDGGASWANLWYWSTDHGPTFETINLDAYVGNTITLRWHYTCTSATSWYWHIDDVHVFDDGGTLLFESFEPVEANLDTSYKMAPPKVEVGEPITYTIVISNSGNLDALATVMTDTLPTGTAYIPGSLSCSGGMCWEDGVAVYWAGTIPSNTLVTIEFAVDVVIPECGVAISNTAIITDPGLDGLVIVGPVWTEVWDFVYLHEDFEGAAFPPPGWVVNDYAGSGVPGSVFTNTNPGGRDNLTGGSGTFAIVDDDEAGSGILSETDMWLPPLDLPPCQSIYLVFKTDYNNISTAETAAVDVSLDGGITWNRELFWNYDVRGPYTEYVDLSAYGGNNGVLIRFYYDDGGSYAWWWEIDDVQVVICDDIPPDLYLTPDYQAGEACPDNVAEYPLTLQNCTGAGDTFDLTPSGNVWNAWVDPASVTLAHGESADLMAYHEVPADADPFEGDMATITAQGTSASDTADVETTASLATGWDMNIADTPQGTRYHGVAYHDGYLYQIGGETGWWVATGTVNRYDIANDIWMTATDMLTPTYGFDAVAIGDYVYVPGGNVATVDPGQPGPRLDWLQIYDPGTDSWSLGATLPYSGGLAYASAVAHGGLLYVIGGLDANANVTNTLYIYDPGTDSWSMGASMAYTRSIAAAGVVGDYIYVAGGWAGGTNMVDSLEIYDIAGNTWMSGPDLPDPGAGLQGWAPFGDGVKHDRYFIVYNGGDVENGTTWSCSYDAYTFDTVTGTWHPLPDLPRCLYGTQGDGDGESLWVISGRTNENGWHMALENQRLLQCAAEGDPAIEVIAPPLEAELCPDETATLDFSICNVGEAPLEWTLIETTTMLAYLDETVVVDVPAIEARPGIASRVQAVEQPARQFEMHIGWASLQPIDLLLVTPDVVGGGDISLLLNTLAAFPDLNVVVWDGNAGTPTVGDMLGYDVVFVGNDILWTSSTIDKTVLSDNLADYIDVGGKVLASGFVWSYDDWGLGGGRFITDDYSPYEIATQDFWDPIALGAYDAGHPIMAGITNVTDNFNHQDPALSSTGTWVASWDDGENFVAVSPGCVGLNQVYFHQADFGGQAGELLHNALLYLETGAGPDVIPWLSEEPTFGTVAMTECMTVTVTFDSTDMDPGEYYAGLIVESNDPVTPVVQLPVTMTVWAPAEILSVTYVISDLTVAFDATVAGEEPFLFDWAFGDGNVSTEEDPVHTYAADGCYTVTLMVDNVCGMDTWSQQICVAQGCLPVMGADFDWSPDEPVISETVAFSGSVAAGDEPITYTWNFGDGTTGEGMYVTHVFTPAAEYTVWMTATNCDGAGESVISHTLTVTDEVEPPPPPTYYYYLPVVLKDT